MPEELRLHKRFVKDARKNPTLAPLLPKHLRDLLSVPRPNGLEFKAMEHAARREVREARIDLFHRSVLWQDRGFLIALRCGPHDDALRWGQAYRGVWHADGQFDVYRVPQADDAPPPTLLPSHGPSKRREDGPPPNRLHDCTPGYLRGLGVPEEWVGPLSEACEEGVFLTALEHLPPSIADLAFRLWHGERPALPEQTALFAPATDAGLLTVHDERELERMLVEPLHRFRAWLHPRQADAVDRTFNGPARIVGAAGTGKSAVAVHRAVRLARAGGRVLLLAFARNLVEEMRRDLEAIAPGVEIEVDSIHAVASRWAEGERRVVDEAQIRVILRPFLPEACPLDERTAAEEFVAVVDAHDLPDAAAYLAADRSGRGFPLAASAREALWPVFARTRAAMAARGRTTWAGLCRAARLALEGPPYDHVIVDEAQDLGPEAVRLAAALVPERGRDNLLLIGDDRQRIYPGGVSMRSLGVDLVGRSLTLRVPYRNSAKIAAYVRRLAPQAAEGDDFPLPHDDLPEGPAPREMGFEDPGVARSRLVEAVRRYAGKHGAGGIGVLVRSNESADRLASDLRRAGIPVHRVKGEACDPDRVNVLTIHRAKGLTFRAVFWAEVEAVADALDREEARRMAYVAASRASERLWVLWSGPRPWELPPSPSRPSLPLDARRARVGYEAWACLRVPSEADLVRFAATFRPGWVGVE